MARITEFFQYLHSIMLHIPQQQYHNISRLMQPQIRSLADSFTVLSPQTRKALGTQVTRPGQQEKQSAVSRRSGQNS